MRQENARGGTGCLMIDDAKPGMERLSGLCAAFGRAGIRTVCFDWDADRSLRERLQCACYEVRCCGETPAIVARGTGCWAALALAAQLPVGRLVLIEPSGADLNQAPRALRRPLAGLRRYARANLSLCLCDMLLLERDRETLARSARQLHQALGRLTGLLTAGKWGISCADEQAIAITAYLQTGEFPKSLAENFEMCIIYG